MICQYFKLPATQEDVMQELFDFKTWPTWWPGLHRLNVITDDGRIGVVDATFKMAATISMRVEFIRKEDHVIMFRQIKGWFKKYEGEWFLQPAPDGVGIVLKVTMKLECGALVPKSMVQSKLSENLTHFGTALVKQLQSRGCEAPTPHKMADTPRSQRHVQPQPAPVQAKASVRKPIHVFQTTEGLEVWIEGRRYIMKST